MNYNRTSFSADYLGSLSGMENGATDAFVGGQSMHSREI